MVRAATFSDGADAADAASFGADALGDEVVGAAPAGVCAGVSAGVAVAASPEGCSFALRPGAPGASGADGAEGADGDGASGASGKDGSTGSEGLGSDGVGAVGSSGVEGFGSPGSAGFGSGGLGSKPAAEGSVMVPVSVLTG